MESEVSTGNDAYKKAIDLLLNMRLEAKQNKDWATSDKIRNELTDLGFEIKDTKDGFEWKIRCIDVIIWWFNEKHDFKFLSLDSKL